MSSRQEEKERRKREREEREAAERAKASRGKRLQIVFGVVLVVVLLGGGAALALTLGGQRLADERRPRGQRQDPRPAGG